jgi:hypothetical protein
MKEDSALTHIDEGERLQRARGGGDVQADRVCRQAPAEALRTR